AVFDHDNRLRRHWGLKQLLDSIGFQRDIFGFTHRNSPGLAWFRPHFRQDAFYHDHPGSAPPAWTATAPGLLSGPAATPSSPSSGLARALAGGQNSSRTSSPRTAT